MNYSFKKGYTAIHELSNELTSAYENELTHDKKQSQSVMEAAEAPKMKTLLELENFIRGKQLPYYQVEDSLGDNGAYSVQVVLKFLSNKFVSVPEGTDDLNIELYLPVDENEFESKCSCRVTTSKDSSVTHFAGYPELAESADIPSTSELASQCDYVAIYGYYMKDALDLMAERCPVARNMMEHITQIQRDTKTLGVAYIERYNRYIMEYNPHFILWNALDEYAAHKDTYKSLVDCYIYNLAFLFTHEMMHLIHHNTTSQLNLSSKGVHEVDNVIQDSFINTKIPGLFRGVPELLKDPPMLITGIGRWINLRAEHNIGFRDFKTVKDLVSCISTKIFSLGKFDDSAISSVISRGVYTSYKVDSLSGADVIIKVSIGPLLKLFNANSAMYQKCINEVLSAITDGRVFRVGGATGGALTDEERLSDMNALKAGTLVKMRGTKDIGVVVSCDEKGRIYKLTRAELDGIKETPIDGTTVEKVEVYKDTGISLEDRERKDICPYEPEPWRESTESRQEKNQLTDDDIAQMNQPESGGEGGMPQPEEPHIFHVGDTVWVPRRKKFGRIKAIQNGAFSLEEVVEKKVKLLDDSDTRVSEGMKLYEDNRVVLKKRVFSPTGRMLGDFKASDLEVFDEEYTESDAPQPKGGQAPQKVSTVPQPVDDDPLKPKEDNQDSSGSDSSSDNGQSDKNSSGENSEEESDNSDGESGDNSSEDDSDDYGGGGASDNDGNDVFDPDKPSDGKSQSGDSEDGDSEGEESDGEDSDGESSDGKSGDKSSDSKGKSGGDSEDGEDSDNVNGESEDGGDSDEEDDTTDGGNRQFGNPSDSSDGDDGDDEDPKGEKGKATKDNTKPSKNQSSDSDSDDDSDENGGEQGNASVFDETGDDDFDPNGGNSKKSASDLEKAMQDISKHVAESEKHKDEVEQKEEQQKRQESEQSGNPENTQNNGVSAQEAQALKDMLGKAIQQAQQSKDSDSSNSSTSESEQSAEDELLQSLNAGSISSVFKPANVTDWRKRLLKLTDNALGIEIMTDPNAINKRIEDTMGREEEYPVISDIAILLDCSGSMGAKKFIQVIDQMNEMFMAKKLTRVKFHIVAWANYSLQDLLKSRYVVARGPANFKREIMHFRDGSGGTRLMPALMLLNLKHKKYDAIFILTDAGMNGEDITASTPDATVCRNFIRKFRKKIIWVLTEGPDLDELKRYDPTALSQKRTVKFRKGGK